MANKLKVEELRAQLSQRGLDTTGTKPFLVKRLEEALLAEIKNTRSADTTDASTSKKRQREFEDGDSEAPDKIRTIEEFRQMGVLQLREEANRIGVSAIGSKKELLERLCADQEEKELDKVLKAQVSQDGDSNVPQKVPTIEEFCRMGVRQLREEANRLGISSTGSKKELLERLCVYQEKEPDKVPEVKEEVKEKRITATKKGGAVLDPWLPDHIKTQYHVLHLGGEIYDAMLNQTNMGANNNKFYLIQALESDAGGTFMVYNRWGRVGVKGQDKLHGPYTSREGAIQEFELKFENKTKNQWSDRANFVCIPKCYTWLEMDYSQTEKESVVPQKINDSIQPRESQLEARIANFISLICNISMMRQQMMEIGYNAEKLPLGKLSKSTIMKGYSVLKRIADVINLSNRKELEQLSGEFYTVIPHDFGFKKMREFVIDTPSKLKGKLQMVEALGEIEVATKLLQDDMEMQENPLYSHYQRLHCDLTPLEPRSEEFYMIEKYMQNTHAKTHSNYTVDIVQMFRVSRQGESEKFQKFCSAKNRMLLWHGSRLSNWAGILSQGLRIAPPEAPVTGYMFGKGVYFADMFSKSANYCYSSQSSRTGVLLLCEVALGEMAELLTANSSADQLPEGKLSTKGVGATAPDASEFKALEDGVIVPLGKPKNQGQKGHLLYNEYIVYNTDQIRMRYVIQVNFHFKR